MMYKAKVAVCSDIRTEHSMQSERYVDVLNVKSWWYVKKPLGFKRLIIQQCSPSCAWVLWNDNTKLCVFIYFCIWWNWNKYFQGILLLMETVIK